MCTRFLIYSLAHIYIIPTFCSFVIIINITCHSIYTMPSDIHINVTSSPAVEFISRVFEQDLPNLKVLNMSDNPLLGEGVDSLIKYLSCAPHLERLMLEGVKMTPQQVMNLTSAVQQHGNITELWSSYHVSFPILSQFVSLFFVYSLFLLSSCLSPFSFLCHFYTRQNTRFAFEIKSQTLADSKYHFKFISFN